MTRLDNALILEVRRRADLERVVGRLVKLKRQGRRAVGLCPFHHERSPSFGVHPSGRYFKCFGCGVSGDAIGFTMRAHGLDFNQAVLSLAQDLGIAVASAGSDPAGSAMLASSREAQRKSAEEWARQEAERQAAERQERDDAIAWCRRLWREARDHPGDPALRYLQGRGLRLASLPPTIRCHPRMPHKETGREMPCMLAAIQDVEGRVVGLHRTFLHVASDGSVHKTALRPAKKMNGEAWGGAVRLSMPAPTLVLGEGIETVLSVMQALDGHVTEHCFWAALSLGNLAGRGRGFGQPHPTRKDQKGHPTRLPSQRPDPEHPGVVLPPWAKRVVILADQDNADPPAAEALLQCAANRFLAQGREVRIARPPEGLDFNDVLKSSPADPGGQSTVSAGGSTPARPPDGADFNDVLRGSSEAAA